MRGNADFMADGPQKAPAPWIHLSRISRTSGLWSLAPKLEKGTSFSIRFRPFRRWGELASRNFLRCSCSGAIGYSYAGTSLSYFAEYPVALEISLLLRIQLIQPALTFGCYASNWRIATGGGKELAVIAHANPPPLYPETVIVIECFI